MECTLIGAPLQFGAGHLDCEMGPSALRIASLSATLEELGHRVRDGGNLGPRPVPAVADPNASVHQLGETVAWIKLLSAAAYVHSKNSLRPFLAAIRRSRQELARRASENDRPLFVLWLEAHTDFHTLETTASGNLHGTPVAYYTGRRGFEGFDPRLKHAVPPENLCMIGIRSIVPAERDALPRDLYGMLLRCEKKLEAAENR